MTNDHSVIGLLFLVDVRMIRKGSAEIIKHKLLVVGCEHSDIERKLKWMFDLSEYSEFSIGATEKVREKVHFLTTTITQQSPPTGPIIESGERTIVAPQSKLASEEYNPVLFAIGLSTTMLAKDRLHALRKVGNAIAQRGVEGKSHSGADLSPDSTLTIEEIPKPSKFATARDVSYESNRARFLRG